MGLLPVLGVTASDEYGELDVLDQLLNETVAVPEETEDTVGALRNVCGLTIGWIELVVTEGLTPTEFIANA